MAEAGIGPFQGLDAGEAVELGELLAFMSDGLAADPNRLDASLYEFVGVPDYVGPVCTVSELRAEVDRFAGLLLGYASHWQTGGPITLANDTQWEGPRTATLSCTSSTQTIDRDETRPPRTNS